MADSQPLGSTAVQPLVHANRRTARSRTGGAAVRDPRYASAAAISATKRPRSGDLVGAPAGPQTPPGLTTVLSVGYLVLDVVTTSTGVGRSAGGTAGNVAANLAWLGRRAGLLARIGDDNAGDLLCRDLLTAGVDTTHIHRSPTVETPVLIQQLEDSGPRYLFDCPRCKRKFASHRPATSEQAEAAAASAPKILFVDRASKASVELMERVRAQGGLVMFEPNGPGRPGLTAQAIKYAHILKVSGDRISSLGTLLECSPFDQIQIRTHGANGLEFRLGGSAWHYRRALPTDVYDSAGAGDWVTAALLARLADDPALTYRNLNEGLKLGQALAAISCQFPGARGMNSAATWDQISLVLTGNEALERQTRPHDFGATRPTNLAGCTACGNG